MRSLGIDVPNHGLESNHSHSIDFEVPLTLSLFFDEDTLSSWNPTVLSPKK